MKKITKNFTLETNKKNYKLFGISSHREFLREKKEFKLRVLKDLQNNPLSLNENYNPVSSSIWNPINMSYQSGKSNNARYNNK
tara:strand:- start:187 stop:435 length:249 start_codon:yes stop_codon:yes gene_type:complete